MRTHQASTALLCAVLLAGCSKPPEPPAPPSPTGAAPAPTVPPAGPGPGNETPTDSLPPGDAPTAPAQPAPDAPSPSEPSAAPKPTSNEPALDSMKIARASSAKIGVPVDLRYQIESDGPGQPVRLHLAAIPRVEGANLEISVQRAEGLELTDGALAVQKATPAGVYRKQVGVLRTASGPRDVQIMVTLGVGEGSAFGFFTVPLESGNISQ